MQFVTWANAIGLGGGLFGTVAAISMTTVIPLRMAGIASAFFFLLFGIMHCSRRSSSMGSCCR